jgi:SSS family solute:Na+ symporter
MTSLDFAVLAAYLLAVLGIAVFASLIRPRQSSSSEGSHYFLADANLTWPVIGLAMFAANISTVQLVSLAQSAYSYGLVYGNFEWMAGFTLVALGLFFAPVYLKSKLPTIPEFFERRYNRLCRDLLTIISLFSALVIHIGVALYTAAYVLESLLNLPPGTTFLGLHPIPFFIIVLGVVTGVYTVFGGLLAVVWTESFQTVLLMIGAIAITVAGWHMVGGLHPLVHTLQSRPHPLAGSLAPNGSFSPDTKRFLTMMRPAKDSSGLPWYSVILGYQVLAVWYWCTDQTIVQRVLAAKDIRHAQLGALFCAWLKILPVFFFVLPGVICVALVQQGAFGGASPGDPVNTYTFMVTHLLPAGLRGLVAAALLAAAMQTCSAALNSIAALVAYDLVKTRRPATTDRDLVRVGRATTAVGTLVAIGLSPIFGHYSSIIEGLNKLISYAAPPITAVALGGIFTRWATARAAVATLILGMCAGITVFLLDWFNIFRPDYMLTTFVSCVVCFLVLYLISRQNPEPLSLVAEGCVWTPSDLQGKSFSMLLPAAAVLCIFAALYVFFW